jgi:uncharacterized membrane protein
MHIEVGGLLGLVVLILDVWGIVNVIQSSAGTATKVLWVVLIMVLPVFGLLLWMLMGPK